MYINYCYTTAQPEATNNKTINANEGARGTQPGTGTGGTRGMLSMAKFYDFSIKYGNVEVLLVGKK